MHQYLLHQISLVRFRVNSNWYSLVINLWSTYPLGKVAGDDYLENISKLEMERMVWRSLDMIVNHIVKYLHIYHAHRSNMSFLSYKTCIMLTLGVSLCSKFSRWWMCVTNAQLWGKMRNALLWRFHIVDIPHF
jgi:hypothetical protein